MLLPGRAIHLSYRCSTCLQVGVDATNLSLLAIATDVKTVEVDENLLSYRKIAMQTACVYVYEDSTCFILERYLLIEVAADVIACDVTFDHHWFINELVATTIDGSLIIALELCNGNYVFLPKQVVTVWRSRDSLDHIRVSVAVTHT